MVVSSKRYPEPLSDNAKIRLWNSWKEPLSKTDGLGLDDFRVLSIGVFLLLFFLDFTFR